MARRNISEGRKAAYYIGMLLMVIGFLTFGSIFLTAACDSNKFENFDAKGRWNRRSGSQ